MALVALARDSCVENVLKMAGAESCVALKEKKKLHWQEFKEQCKCGWSVP